VAGLRALDRIHGEHSHRIRHVDMRHAIGGMRGRQGGVSHKCRAAEPRPRQGRGSLTRGKCVSKLGSHVRRAEAMGFDPPIRWISATAGGSIAARGYEE
jgi:hypothetical protein